MVQVCTKCSRTNPPEAVYCHHDGFVLGGHERRGGPVAVGAQLFRSPFVFPTGRTCRNFDELALGCQEEWGTACSLLAEGFLESFFHGLGRADLACAARDAAAFPDLERGLDRLLGELPTTALESPRLRAEPAEVNLGVLDGDRERGFELDLENRGMRLLVGTLSSPDAAWLALGEGAGTSEKHFHLLHELRVAVRAVPARARASSKPLEARLLVESNGGIAEVVVRAERPVQPFPAGPLGGAKSPREVAERAQASPREVAPLFESGDVERWYAANGWTYPVKVPAASGVAAIQQFFEALGVTRAPKVEISHRELHVSAEVGDKVPLGLEVTTKEKRPVFAHATSNVPWLEVARPRHVGKSVVQGLTIPSVPNRPGEVLEGKVVVVANGNQRFVVPVRLSIHARSARSAAGPVVARPSRAVPAWLHAVPAVLLVLAVLGVVIADLSTDRGKASADERFGQGPVYDPASLRDARPRIGVRFNADNRFGLVQLDAAHPDQRDRWKPLTAKEDGSTNNTVVRIGGSEYHYGDTLVSANTWAIRRQELQKPYIGWVSEMDFTGEQVRVRQHVQIVPGATRELDTCLIYYVARNYGTLPRKLGLRVMLDTYIGNNDGVPFTVPGLPGFVRDKARLPNERIRTLPDYLEVVESPDNPSNPGTIARLGLRNLRWGPDELSEPDAVVISHHPGDRKSVV